MSNGLTAGVARAPITPPIGLQAEGYILRVEPLVGINADLTVTALVFADDRAKIAIIDCDILGLTVSASDALRDRIAAAIGVSRAHVLLAWSHTHNGPRLRLTSYVEDAAVQGSDRLHQTYYDNFCQLVVSAAKLADDRRRPARVGAGSTTSPVAIHRRERQADGSVILGQNPAGPTDHEVGVIRIDATDGAPIAALVNYAAHPVVLGPEPLLFDPDYPGVVRRIVERATGAMCLFLMGAAGDQMPIEAWTVEPAIVTKIGAMIGHAAASAYFGIETRQVEVVKRHVKSLAEVLAYDVVPRPGPTHRFLGAVERRVELPRSPLPSLAEAESVVAKFQAEYDRAVAAGESARVVHLATIELGWANNVLATVKSGQPLPPMTGVVQAVRLDDIGIATAPGEAFVELGLAVKRRSPLRHTFYASYANGGLGYIPTPDAYPQPGQRVLTPDNVYYKGGLLAPLGPACASIVVETGLNLLQELATSR